MLAEASCVHRRRLIALAAASIALGAGRAALAQDARGSAAPGKSEPAARPDAKPPLPGRALPGGLREISWDDLIPEDWDPAKQLPFRMSIKSVTMTRAALFS